MFDDDELVAFVQSYCGKCAIPCDDQHNMGCAFLGTATALKVADEMTKCEMCLEKC